MSVFLCTTAQQREQCFPVMVQLRPWLSLTTFLEQVNRQAEQGYRLVCCERENEVCGVAGFRCTEMLAMGRMLYVDDLVTDAKFRSQGVGEEIFEWLVEYAKREGCATLELDSGVQRFDAHRFYLRQRMIISSHHFRLALSPPGATP